MDPTKRRQVAAKTHIEGQQKPENLKEVGPKLLIMGQKEEDRDGPDGLRYVKREFRESLGSRTVAALPRPLGG